MKFVDHYTDNPRRSIEPKAHLTYDFYFRKKGSKIWRYLNSTNDITRFNTQKATTVDSNGEYLIMAVRTGQIVEQG